MLKKKKKFDKKKRPRRKQGIYRKKFCEFCKNKSLAIDYKDVSRLQKYTTERGKILPSRISGNCPKHQREIASAIKRARTIALIPYIASYR